MNLSTFPSFFSEMLRVIADFLIQPVPICFVGLFFLVIISGVFARLINK